MCCCCGLKLAHVASIILVVMGLGFALSALSSTGEVLPWGSYNVKVHLGGRSCESFFNFGLEKYGGELCITLVTPKEEIHETAYSSGDCRLDVYTRYESYCDVCDNAGKSIEGLLSMAIISSLISIAAIVWRMRDAMAETDTVEICTCSVRKGAAIGSTTSCVMWVVIS
ncbi:hypothetical protein AAMO2058_000754900 [Amorphochlora amoebiformis]